MRRLTVSILAMSVVGVMSAVPGARAADTPAAPSTVRPGTVSVAAPALAVPEVYDVSELPTPPGWARAYCVATNGKGKSVGYVEDAGGNTWKAVVWDGASAQVLPLSQGYAADVLDTGTVLGLFGAFPNVRGFVDGSPVPAAILGGSGSIRVGYVAGFPGSVLRAVKTQGSPAPIPLQQLGLASAAYAVNGSGVMVGAAGPSLSALAAARPVRWDSNGQGVFLPGGLGRALAINNRGTIVGRVGTPGPGERAARWTDGQLALLGSLGGRSGATSVNAFDRIVGWSYDGEGNPLAFLYKEGSLVDLNTLVEQGTAQPAVDWILQSAMSIADNGQICGYGYMGGKVHAFLAKPKPKSQTSRLVAPLELKAAVRQLRPPAIIIDGKERLLPASTP